ncbi:ATP-binding protein [Arthrobacter sp. zg-Y1116]|uniref:ATP-binding protein n=1 Tax=Arthrobacter sp. zg-Y1116 TaxID=2964611 RepID=UPI0021047F6E|nr:ATP-binding protein [Arthrobacter sp. zg-Y1116]MCQ1948110.1 ATP-binding protein [Arthrobacter sp. zg-Y1116]
MSEPDLLRPSRDGDQFHYTWAARQSLRLLDKDSGLHALFVEAVDPSEQTTGTVAVSASDNAVNLDDDIGTGDEVIDLAEYWGSSDISRTERVVYRQFKHSTRHGDSPWTLSFLTKTLIGFARKYRDLKAKHQTVLDRVQFEFVSNRPAAVSAIEALTDLRTGVPSSATRTIRERLLVIITADEISDLCQRLIIDERAPSLLKLRHLLDLEVADLLPGAPGEQALLLREMISSRATSIAGDNPAVRRTDVLASLKTSEDQLLPAPNLIAPPTRPLDRRQFADVARKIQKSNNALTVVHGPGGVGKSVLAGALGRKLPNGSTTVVFDCFGNGSYRRPSAPRHRAKQGFVQLVNELAGRALCDPLIPSASADDADYALAFIRKLTKAAESVATTAPAALLMIVIDAADNAAMIADEMGEHSFVRGLVRESLPENVRLVLTCRTERIGLLGLPADYQDIPLQGFDLNETLSHLRTTYPNVSAADASEFHTQTSHNPRVQAAVLDATNDLREALAWLAPHPTSPGQALDSFIERHVAELRDRQHASSSDIDAICVGLASLRPMIPVRVLAELANIHPSVVLSFISDLGRPLLVDGDTVQFRDEPTETWFRNHYRPAGKDLDSFIERLSPIADQDAYVAASLPALLFEANRFDDLVQLALSDDRLPDNDLPAPQRNEIQRSEIAQQRTHFALAAALRADRDFEAAQLALRLGALTAGRTRRLDLIRENTDLAARFLDPAVLEQLMATRSLTAGWPNSNLLIEGALLASAAGQTDQARNRLRSAMSWMHAWIRQAHRDGSKSGVQNSDFLQVSWGLLNAVGPTACVQFLRSWRPRSLAYDVGVDIARRLLDAGRLAELVELARSARGLHLKLAIAHACAERDVDMDAATVAHLLRPFLKRNRTAKLNGLADRRSTSDDPFHNGLTAIIWLTGQAVAREVLAPTAAAQLLRGYLPENLGYQTGSWHDRDIWSPVLGLTLCARFEGRVIDPIDIQGPHIREAREREKFESSQDLRAYRTNVEPLVSWAAAWVDLILDQTPEKTEGFSQRISEFLQEAPPAWRQERIDQTKVNTVMLLIGRALARFPGIADPAAVLAYHAGNKDIIMRRTLINLIRQTAADPANHGLSFELARRCHEDLANAREDAGELASDFVQLARATHRISPEESIVHFQAAIDITNAIGDDAWVRWKTLLDIAGHAGQGTLSQPARAYRLCQIGESLEPYLYDYLSHTDALSVAARLSLPEALAAGSRWRDRRISPIQDLANAITTNPALLLNSDPLAALVLLPLGSCYPDHTALGSALTTVLDDATPVIVTYLRFRRNNKLTTDALDELLNLSCVPRTAIAHIDPSLLQASSASAYHFTTNDHPGKDAETSFVDVDLLTAAGWTAALQRDDQGYLRRDLFSYVADMAGSVPGILRAFIACPTTKYQDLSSLLDSLQGRSVSMATQAALDEVLSTQVARFAPDLLLVPWDTLDYQSARVLSGRHTDYEHIASRALAEQQSFTADQAYALATHLGRRLTVDKALELFDVASSYFDDPSPLDAHDGHHPHGITTEICDTETALATVIWTALGDPAGKTRWEAAHSVHLALTLGHTGLVSSLLDLASGLIDPGPFLDSRLEFYDRHALQWLLFGIGRATVEPIGLATAALCEDLLMKVVAGTPHAVNTPLARDSLLRLHSAGLITLDSAEKNRIEQAGRPIGTTRPDSIAEVSSQKEVKTNSETNTLSRPEPARNEPGRGDSRRLIPGFPAEKVANEVSATLATQSAADDDADDDRFRFFFDFRQYWCNPLGDAFGLSERSIERLVMEVLVEHWAVSSRGRREDDNRHSLGLYPEGAYTHKGEWPEEEDLDFYLAIQGLCEVAGVLLQHRPVVQRYDEDEETGSSEYSRFLEWHIPSRDDGRWLSDRRDAAPEYARLESEDPSGLGAGRRDPYWIYRITPARFRQELFLAPEQIVVWGFRSAAHYSQRETVSVRSALVTAKSAPALLKTLQTSPDKHAYRIPDTSDSEFQSSVPGFELTGWIEPSGYTSGRDRQDPYAKSVSYPPIRPTNGIQPLESLAPDADLRLWREGEKIVIEQTTWDDLSDERNAIGSSGDTLTANLSWLTGVLDKLDRWLIVEVEIMRRSNDSAVRGSKYNDDEEHFSLLRPYTKYFLIDTTGNVHEF